jgi:hypothetical protein
LLQNALQRRVGVARLLLSGRNNPERYRQVEISHEEYEQDTFDSDGGGRHRPFGSGRGGNDRGYALQVAYATADLTGVSFLNDPNNMFGDGTDPIFDLSGGFGFPGAGFLDLFVISTMLDAQLTALQGPFPSSFILASVVFDRTSPTAGTNLDLVNVSLSNADGSATIPLGDAAVVPEPTTMLLLGTGLSALVMRRRKANKPQQ